MKSGVFCIFAKTIKLPVMQNKFPVIKALGGIFRFFGWLAAGIAVIVLLVGFVTYRSADYSKEEAEGISLMLVGLWMLISGLLSVAGGELLKLLLAMENHLSETHQLLFKQWTQSLDNKSKEAH